jgi:uncharacterized protein
MRLILLCSVLLLSGFHAFAAESAARELDWLELMPKDEVEALMEAPTVAHEGMFKSEQTGSFKVIKELDGSRVRIAGYIVPVEVDSDNQMSQFFIVPYFGACIHVPPPPPNQIILARLAEPIPVTEIYDAYWIEGTLNVETIKNDIAASAYTLSASKVTLWE